MSTTNVTLSSMLLSIQQKITLYLYPIYLVLGMTGCFLNILVMSRRQFRMVSCCTYFIVASMGMIIYMSQSLASSIYALYYPDPNLTIVAYCKLRFYINQWSTMVYRWCLTVACVDRYALSSTSARLRNFSEVRVARRVVIGIVVVWLMIPIYTLVFYNLRGGSCGILYNPPVAIFHSLLTTITGAVLPVLIMITCASLIRHNLELKRQRRQHNSRPSAIERNDDAQYLQRKRDRQVLLMLIGQALVFVVSQTPLMVFYIYQAVSLFIKNKSAEMLALDRFFQFLAITISMIFPVSSFYLYTVSSRTYREALVSLLRSLPICGRFCGSNRIETTATDAAHRRTQGNPLPDATRRRTAESQAVLPAIVQLT